MSNRAGKVIQGMVRMIAKSEVKERRREMICELVEVFTKRKMCEKGWKVVYVL